MPTVPAQTVRRYALLATAVVLFVSIELVASPPASAMRPSAPASGAYAWPVTGPVIHGFEQPNGPYGPGHRGIDIAAPMATPVVAAQDGTVAFAGWVAGSLFLSIDHPDGYRSTYSWLSAVSVRKGDPVLMGQVVASSGHGHPEVPSPPHLHFGVRLGSVYLDPMTFLEAAGVADLIHLAPLDGSGSSGAWLGGETALVRGDGVEPWRPCPDPTMAPHPCSPSMAPGLVPSLGPRDPPR